MCVSSDGNRCSFLCLGILVMFYNWEEERFLSALKQERNFRGMDKETASYRESRMSRSKHKTSATLSFINHLRRELYDYIQQRICMSKKLVVSVLNFQVPCPGLASPLLCLAPALYTVSREGVHRQIFCALSKATLLGEGWQQRRSPGLWLCWQRWSIGFSWGDLLNWGRKRFSSTHSWRAAGGQQSRWLTNRGVPSTAPPGASSHCAMRSDYEGWQVAPFIVTACRWGRVTWL